MRFPNGFFGNGPGNGDDSVNQRDVEAYNRSRIQFTVATSTFAGVAIVGMFCSCLWFVCCRHSSKTHKKGRTWAHANQEAAMQNPYSYDGYVDSHGYSQMNNEGLDGVAPYMNNPLYHSQFYGENGLTTDYDFNDNFGFSEGGKAELIGNGTGALTISNSVLTAGATGAANMNKDVPPSYTALFFSTADSTGVGSMARHQGPSTSSASAEFPSTSRSTVPVTNIQPIHLTVTSHVKKLQEAQYQASVAQGGNEKKEQIQSSGRLLNPFEDFMDRRGSNAPSVSLMSIESEPDKASSPEGAIASSGLNDSDADERRAIPPPYNSGSKGGYLKF